MNVISNKDPLGLFSFTSIKIGKVDNGGLLGGWFGGSLIKIV
jgi:hypothetical protein